MSIHRVRGKMVAGLVTLYQRRYLLWMWTFREVRLRYKQAFLGFLWAILQPLALMLIFTFVFSIIVRLPSDDVPYPIFSYTALLPWTFLASAIGYGTSSLVNNMNLVTKVNIPREVLPLASVGAGLLDFLISLLIYFFLLAYYRQPLTVHLVWLPYLVVVQVALTAGVVLLLSALNVFFRDIRFAVPLFVQLWMYASPIIYPANLVPQRYQRLYMLNPVAGLIDSYRAIFLRGEAPSLTALLPATVVSCAILVIGYAYFKRVEWRFADVI